MFWVWLCLCAGAVGLIVMVALTIRALWRMEGDDDE